VTEDRRQEDRQLNAIMELMATNHQTVITMIDQAGDNLGRRIDDLAKRFDSEIPDGHGAYHAELIASAARQQAFREAIKHKVGGWAVVGLLAALAAWGWDWIVAHIKVQ
jgi:hypothetical protein